MFETWPKRSIVQRIIRAWLLLWLAVILSCAATATWIGRDSPLMIACALAFSAMFFGHFIVVFGGMFVQSRAQKLVDEAEAIAARDPDTALAHLRRALHLGPRPPSITRAWMLAAQIAEERKEWKDVRFALERALDRQSWHAQRSLLVDIHLRLAFACAVLGDVGAATKHIGIFGSVDQNQPRLVARHLCARAILAFKQGHHRDVVDIVENGRGIILDARDAALLRALEQSSMMRMEGLRAAAPTDPIDDWMESVAPELAAR